MKLNRQPWWAQPILPGLLLAVSCAQAAPLNYTNLLIYTDKNGKIAPVKSVSDWNKRRNAILEGMQEVMGRLPGKSRHCPLDVRMIEEVDCGNYVRRSITY